MSTKNIIDDLLLGNLSEAKTKTENALYSKMKEALDDIKNNISSDVYSDYVGSFSMNENEAARQAKNWKVHLAAEKGIELDTAKVILDENDYYEYRLYSKAAKIF